MKNVKAEIEMHLDKARALAADAGMELEDFMGEKEMPEEEEGYEEEPAEKPGMDKGKIALIIAKMKKAKGE